MSVAEEKKNEVGFELNGDFYPWSVSDNAKDLMLIDRFTGLPAYEFYEQIEDSFDRGRGPFLLAMIATSMRAKNPDWSVNRIERTVMAISMADVEFIGGDTEEEDARPPESSSPPPSEDRPSRSSKKSSGPQEPQSETLPETPS